MGQVRQPFREIADIQTGAIEQGLAETRLGGAEALETLRGGVTSATGALDPFAQAGVESLDFFNALTGISGDPDEAVARFESSPFARILEQNLQQAQQATTRQFAAGGELQSGRFGQALQDVTSQQVQQGLLGFTGLLEGGIGRGQQAAGQQAGILFGGAGQQAGVQQALGTAAAEAQIAQGSARAGQIANELTSGLFKF